MYADAPPLYPFTPSPPQYTFHQQNFFQLTKLVLPIDQDDAMFCFWFYFRLSYTSLFSYSYSIIVCYASVIHKLNMELDLQKFLGSMCTAVLIV